MEVESYGKFFNSRKFTIQNTLNYSWAVSVVAMLYVFAVIQP